MTHSSVSNARDLFGGVVVVVAPHMDDETLACGGAMAGLPDKGRVHVIFATDGARSPVPILAGWSARNESLPAIRRREALQALAVLQIPESNVHFLDLADGNLGRERGNLHSELATLIRRLAPETLLIPFRFDRHPDHLAVNRTVHAIVNEIGSRSRVIEYFVYYRWRLLPAGDVRRYVLPDKLLTVDIGDYSELKRRALDQYVSQTKRFFPWQDRPVLSSANLAASCRGPEQFLACEAPVRSAKIFKSLGWWIPFAHAIEPPLKQIRELLRAVLRRGVRDDVG